jgi:hypothetical protein
MNKTVLGFIVVALFLFAGVFELIAEQTLLGVLFILLAIANAVIFIKLNKLNRKD